MKITRLDDAVTYSAPKHSAVHTMHMQHKATGSVAPFSVGCSYYLPGSRAQWDATPTHKVYIVLDGEITVQFENEAVVLGPMDSVSIEANESREVRNETNRVVTMLVVMEYPPEG